MNIFYVCSCIDGRVAPDVLVSTACASRSSQFKLDYDKLVLAVGTDTNTFGLPGVNENAFFLKEVEHAVQIRKRVMANFETAALPSEQFVAYPLLPLLPLLLSLPLCLNYNSYDSGYSISATSQQERERLLHFVVVGGGPTGVEAAAEFADFMREDMKRFFPEVRVRFFAALAPYSLAISV